MLTGLFCMYMNSALSKNLPFHINVKKLTLFWSFLNSLWNILVAFLLFTFLNYLGLFFFFLVISAHHCQFPLGHYSRPACISNHSNTLVEAIYLSFSGFWGFVKFVIFFEIVVFFFNKNRYELCTCVNMKIDTCANIVNVPVLITTYITYLQTLVAK